METRHFTPNVIIPGEFTTGTLPDAVTHAKMFAWNSTEQCYMESDGSSWKATTALKRVETYSGVTNASGDYTVVYSQSYAEAPHVDIQLTPPTDVNISARLTASSTTGFTVKVEQQAVLTVAGFSVRAGTATNVAGANVTAFVCEMN